MKNVILACLLIILSSCKSQDYYHGYVLNDRSEPLKNVSVTEDNKFPTSTVTDSKGYFKLQKSPETISSLIFSFEGHHLDTVATIWNRYNGGGKRFLNKLPDTLIMREKVAVDHNN